MPDSLPGAHGTAVLAAAIRTTPEDFFVEEIDAFAPSGEGEHLLLDVEKRGMNTAFAAKLIAQWAGIADMAVGYAGLKDRHAVTRQRFSVHLPGRAAPDIDVLQAQGLRVLGHAWHAKKLPRGALAGNRFQLVLRDVQGDRDVVATRLRAIAGAGVPNYFGEQRFGREGANLGNALAMFAGQRVARAQRTYLLSAARSELFNRVLAARVRDGSWNLGLEGEVWALDGSRSVFGPEPWSDALAERLGRFDIHPSAPLWGRGELRSTGAARQVEEASLTGDTAMALRVGLESAGLRQERRATRLRPGSLAWAWQGDDALVVAFTLPPGTYATTVLAELGAVHDLQGGQRPFVGNT
jgi:tRNA pseudouridine13 synthase